MKKLQLIKVGILLAGCCLLPAAHVQAVDVGITLSTGPAVVYPDAAPPAPIVEVQPASPAPGYVWIGGSWVWGDDHRWTWEKGRWEAPRAGMHYVPHHYEEHDGRHEFHRGGWQH